MNEYRRPTIPVKIYRDELGTPIDYGNRWGGAGAPVDAYSRVSNRQRFAPLHAVAMALIEWLQDTFDVTLAQGPSVASDLLRMPHEVISAVRVVPREPEAAPLTFVLTQFPGVYLHAGSLHDFQFPGCGCDACDDDATGLAEELEWTVRTVVSGGYSERFDPWPGRWFEYRIDEPGARMHSGRSRSSGLPKDRVKSARATLPPAGQWPPWQLLPQSVADAAD